MIYDEEERDEKLEECYQWKKQIDQNIYSDIAFSIVDVNESLINLDFTLSKIAGKLGELIEKKGDKKNANNNDD